MFKILNKKRTGILRNTWHKGEIIKIKRSINKITSYLNYRYICTIAIYMNMRNVHGMFIHIYIEHRNLEKRKTVRTSQFRYETFYYP